MVLELLGGFNCSKALSSGWAWKLKDGRTIELLVKIKEKNDD
nr:MAG TPA: beta-lactamase inhibitor [Caudoviricetes sp.]